MSRRTSSWWKVSSGHPAGTNGDLRPDHDHEGLSPRRVAELLGVKTASGQGRIHRGTLPAEDNGGRFWVRRDHLEQVEAARLVRKTRRLRAEGSWLTSQVVRSCTPGVREYQRGQAQSHGERHGETDQDAYP